MIHDTKAASEGADEILAWIGTHGIADKDAAAARRRFVGSSSSAKIEKRRGEHRMVIDLHGMRSEEAVDAVRRGLDAARHAGCASVIFVHGKGHHSPSGEGPVLKSLVRGMLENELALQVKDHFDAPPEAGGSGATIAWLAR